MIMVPDSPDDGAVERTERRRFGRGYAWAAPVARLSLALALLAFAFWYALFHLLMAVFLPLFFLIDWLRPSTRQNPGQVARFLWDNRPRWGRGE